MLLICIKFALIVVKKTNKVEIIYFVCFNSLKSPPINHQVAFDTKKNFLSVFMAKKVFLYILYIPIDI